LLEMLFRLGSLAGFKKQIPEIDVSAEMIWIIPQRLAVFRDGLFWRSVFFQERAVAIVRLRRPRLQTHSGLAFSCGLFFATKLLQQVRVARMVFGVRRFAP